MVLWALALAVSSPRAMRRVVRDEEAVGEGGQAHASGGDWSGGDA